MANGNVWPLLDGRAPQMVMAPDNGADSGWDIDSFVQHHIIDLGFTGVHRPGQGLPPNQFDYYMATLADELGFVYWYWTYGDVDGGSAPSDGLGFQHNREFQYSVVDFFKPFTNVVNGLGYDCREWVSDNEGNRWYRNMKSRDPQRLFAIRARLDENRRNPDAPGIRQGYRPGDIASYEVRLTDGFTIDDLIDDAFSPVFPGEPHIHRPVANMERFRVGPRAKDIDYEDVAPLLDQHISREVGAVYGDRLGLEQSPNWRWPETIHDDIKQVTGIVEPTPEPEPEEYMYHVKDHKNFRIKFISPDLSTGDEPYWVSLWEGDGTQPQQHVIDIDEDVAVQRIEYFFGAIRGYADEYTGVVEIQYPGSTKWIEIDVGISEKEGATTHKGVFQERRISLGFLGSFTLFSGVPASTHTAHVVHELPEDIFIPEGSKLRVTAWHNIPDNVPHLEAKLRCKKVS